MIKGIKLDSKKKMSISNEIVDFSNPSKVYVPLINNNVLCECLVKKGKKVRKGTIIGIRNDINFPILSPVSGTVLEIKECLYLTNKMIPCVVISNDKKERLIKNIFVKDISEYTKDEYIELLRKCAVTGMGGSDFPTFLKYVSDINTLIVNAVECEPYVTSDLMLVKLKADIILDTIEAIMKINNISTCYIAFKKENKTVYYSFLKYIKNYNNIFLCPLKDIYPMGWERHIVKKILKIDYNKYPSEIGVVVNNVSTIFAIYKALKFQRSVTKRIITISGENFSEQLNILAKVGTDAASIIKKIGYYEEDNIKLIAGGPMMGYTLKNDSVIITNNLNSLIVLKDEEEIENNCIGCGKCISICQSNLCPVFIMKNKGNKDELKVLHPEMCCECGLCSYICPSKISLREYVKDAKKEVK